jgi:parallel beta-helix repeat protein
MRFLLLFCLLFSLLVFTISPGGVAAQDEEYPEEEIVYPAPCDSTGLYFEIVGAAFTISIATTDSVQIMATGTPDVLEISLAPHGETTATTVTVSGLPSSATRYRYTDHFNTYETETTDPGGSLVFSIDLTDPHVVFLQSAPSTVHLAGTGWNPAGVGTWDPTTRTATLTQDVFETLSIDTPNITLDGGGFQILVAAGYGVAVNNMNQVTLRNLDIVSEGYGVYANNCNDLTVKNCVIQTDIGDGIVIYRGNNFIIRDNDVSSATSMGIRLYQSYSGNVLNNTVSSPLGHALYSGRQWDQTTVSFFGNTVTESHYGLVVAGSTYYGYENFRVDDNIINCTLYGIYAKDMTNLSITGNDITYAISTGIFLVNTRMNQSEGILNNRIFDSDPTQGYKGTAMLISQCYGAVVPIQNNEIDVWGGGIHLGYADRWTISGNNISSGGSPVLISRSERCILEDNVLTATKEHEFGFRIIYSSSVYTRNNDIYAFWPFWLYRSYSGYLYNNNFFVSPEYGIPNLYLGSAYIHDNYWASYPGVDADGDGRGDTPYVFTSSYQDTSPWMDPSGWLRTTVHGTVFSDCDGRLPGVNVFLEHPDGTVHQEVSNDDGHYFFEVLQHEQPALVYIEVPLGYEADNPAGGTASVELVTSEAIQPFALICADVDVSGTLVSDCGGPVAGVPVNLAFGTSYLSQVTDSNGAFLFPDLPRQTEPGEISIIAPLGLSPVSPVDGHIAVDMSDDSQTAFTLECLDAVSTARGLGYWKHQARVYTRGKGNAHETEADMTTLLPQAIFNHFHENELNGIAVMGITYIMPDGVAIPIDLATIENTLTVNQGGTMLQRAKQHYLALLLNLASEKLQTYSVVSEDGLTASQALQDVASMINDGNPANDGQAKDIGNMINEGEMVPAGMISDEWSTIFYRPPSAEVGLEFALEQNRPNPFNPVTTIAFHLPEASGYDLFIYSVSGRLVRQESGNGQVGWNQWTWQGRDNLGGEVASGVYYYRLHAKDFVETRKMTLVR